MGNEIADAAAQTSLKHDIPQFLDIRQKFIDSQERIKKKWEKIYQQLYAVSTIFANVSRSRQAEANETIHPSIPTYQVAVLQLDPHSLRIDNGYHVLGRSTWGATYSAYLYSY